MSDAWSSDTDTDNEDIMITPPPKKKTKAFAVQLQRSAEKPVSQMNDRERSRRTENYVHPEFCCHRKHCCEHIAVDVVRDIRSRVWNDYREDPKAAKVEIARVWDEVFLVNGQRCCVDFLTNAFGVSRTYMYPDKRNKKKFRAADAKESIINFFEELKKDSDMMPDSAEYHLYAPKKASVYEWYCERPGAVPCGRQFFLKKWRELFPDVKLRKYLRFSKCKTCEVLKQVVNASRFFPLLYLIFRMDEKKKRLFFILFYFMLQQDENRPGLSAIQKKLASDALTKHRAYIIRARAAVKGQ